MRRGIATAFFLSLSLSAHSAYADSGTELLHECLEAQKLLAGVTNNVDVLKASYCLTYIEGFRDSLVMNKVAVETEGMSSEQLICMPENINNGHLIKIVTRFIEDTPVMQKEHKAAVVYGALYSSYGC